MYSIQNVRVCVCVCVLKFYAHMKIQRPSPPRRRSRAKASVSSKAEKTIPDAGGDWRGLPSPGLPRSFLLSSHGDALNATCSR